MPALLVMHSTLLQPLKKLKSQKIDAINLLNEEITFELRKKPNFVIALSFWFPNQSRWKAHP